MPNTVRKLLALTLFSLLGTSAVAQQGLVDVYRLAESNDPTLRQAQANMLAELETKPQARSSLLPNLSFSAGSNNNFSENPNPSYNFITGEPVLSTTGSQNRSSGDNWNVNLSQTLFDWGQILSLKQADKRIAQSEIVYETAQQTLLIRVSEAYFNVLAAEDLLAAEVATRESTDRQREQAQRRFDVGLIPITEVQQAQAAYDNAVASEIAQQRSLATAQESLREIVGMYVSDLRGPTDELPLQPPDPQSAEDWVTAALKQNLNLNANRLAVDIADDDVRIQRSVRLPTLSLSGGYNGSGSTSTNTVFYADAFCPDPLALPPCGVTSMSQRGSTGRNFSLNLRVPLFSGGVNGSRIRQSVYRRRAAQENVELIARQTERQTRDAYLGVISTIAQVQALRQAVESSRTALRATEAGFEVGTQTTVEVLSAQDNLRRAETNYARSRYDYILNVLRLRQAAGTLSIDDMQQVDGWLE